MNTTTRISTAERLGRALGRGWRAYARGERRVTNWLVSKRVPLAGAAALLWAGAWAGWAAAMGLGLALVRSQATVGDVAWMKAMIPHHSIAINNARKADIRDPRVRYLADRITRDQIKEITEMKMLIDDIEKHGRRADALRPAGPTALTPKSAQEAKDLVSGKLLQDEPL